MAPLALAFLALAAMGGTVVEGAPGQIGNGRVTSFADISADGTPRSIGLVIEAAAFEGLPAERNATSRCFDKDGDGQTTAGECEGDTELRLPLPTDVAGHEDIPFAWVMVNWQPQGHDPMPWSVPHFDIHFYMIPEAELDAIGVGPCDFFIDCTARERALKPVPAEFVNPDHISVGATVGQMGNHLIDSKTPELGGHGVPFTHTWIFGAYDGRIIFHEVMVTRDHLLGGETGCHPIKQPAAWEVGGWYPTTYCIGYDDGQAAHTVTMQDFVLRPGSRQVSALEETAPE